MSVQVFDFSSWNLCHGSAYMHINAPINTSIHKYKYVVERACVSVQHFK